ncbi:MAG: retropepsin-like aspartic protease, partial [Pirellulaceae bacterium]|nr:retropepsin-like aspartic protease [Pirellulaceae bacterium]
MDPSPLHVASIMLVVLPAVITAQTGTIPGNPLAGGLHVGAIRTTTLPINSPPIGGFTPLVIFGLTNEKKPDVGDWFAQTSAPPSGTALPAGLPAHYAVAFYDTGATAHLIRDDEMAVFDLASVGRVGSNTQLVTGLAGSELATISDPVAVYVAGFDAATGGPSLSVNSSALQGHMNVAIMIGEAGSTLPNIIGAPISHQYTTVIRNDQPQQLVIGSDTFDTPLVQLIPRSNSNSGSLFPTTQFTAMLSVEGLQGVLNSTDPPVFIPNFLDPNGQFHNDPLSPSIHGLYMMDVDVLHSGLSQLDQRMLVDFGAEVSVISTQVADDVGLDVAAPGFVPDFTVDVAGAGGMLFDVPGVFLDSFNLDVTGGALDYTNTPVLIVDLPDPRGGSIPLPGIVGTNLFTD